MASIEGIGGPSIQEWIGGRPHTCKSLFEYATFHYKDDDEKVAVIDPWFKLIMFTRGYTVIGATHAHSTKRDLLCVIPACFYGKDKDNILLHITFE